MPFYAIFAQGMLQSNFQSELYFDLHIKTKLPVQPHESNEYLMVQKIDQKSKHTWQEVWNLETQEIHFQIKYIIYRVV